MTFDDFFVLDAELGRPQGAFWFRSASGRSFDFYDAILRAQAPEDCVVDYAVDTGRRLADVMGTSLGKALIVTERVVRLLEEKQLTGWRAYRTRLLGKSGEELEGRFFSLGVLGRAGPVDADRFMEEEYVRPSGAKARRKCGGPFFHLEQWDGSDLSVIDQRDATIVTRRTLAAFENAGIRNWTARCLTK